MADMKWIVIHCSASPPYVDGDAEWIDRIHKGFGWRGCGYHIVIKRDGEMQSAETGHSCRQFGEPAAHARGTDGDGAWFNRHGIGICLIGGVDANGVPENNYTAAQWATLLLTVRQLMDRFGIPPDKIAGHRDIIRRFDTPDGPKECPCFEVDDWVRREITGLDDPDAEMGGDIISNAVTDNTTHVVRSGETFWGIGRLYGVPQSELRRLNPNYPRLYPGDTVLLAA